MQKIFTTEEIIKTEEFNDFYKTVIEFCDFIENYSATDKMEFLKIAKDYLLRLYFNTSKLQWVDLRSNIEYDEKIDGKIFNNVLLFIAERLGDSRYYWHVLDPTNSEEKEPVCGDLVDDLGDIYKDLKYSIMIFNLNKHDCKENALWQFKFDFDKHWDNHCINALSAIHFYSQHE